MNLIIWAQYDPYVVSRWSHLPEALGYYPKKTSAATAKEFSFLFMYQKWYIYP